MAKELKKILYVDDEPDIRAVARIALESVGGFDVGIFSSGRAALESAQSFCPDLFLLDVMMPDMDGPATLAGLQKLPGLEQIPAIFITTKVQPHEIDFYKSLGAMEVIAKPFDPMTLAGTIRNAWEININSD